MNELVSRFQQFHRKGTRQIGPYFCIPAVISNATRLLGLDEYTQETIRDVWYAEQGGSPEPNIDAQMFGAGPSVFDALEARTDFKKQCITRVSEQPREESLFNEEKADRTIAFIAEHLGRGSPVLVSTDCIPWERGILTRICCHMWLALHVDVAENLAVCHDPDNDQLFQIPVRMAVPAILGDRTILIEIGLQGRLTTSNYYSVAFAKP